MVVWFWCFLIVFKVLIIVFVCVVSKLLIFLFVVFNCFWVFDNMLLNFLNLILIFFKILLILLVFFWIFKVLKLIDNEFSKVDKVDGLVIIIFLLCFRLLKNVVFFIILE